MLTRKKLFAFGRLSLCLCSYGFFSRRHRHLLRTGEPCSLTCITEQFAGLGEGDNCVFKFFRGNRSLGLFFHRLCFAVKLFGVLQSVGSISFFLTFFRFLACSYSTLPSLFCLSLDSGTCIALSGALIVLTCLLIGMRLPGSFAFGFVTLRFFPDGCSKTRGKCTRFLFRL